ncbi:hypothetical protein DFA_12270 [Cavenderia fasciculata]|uniref:SHSP domain-containing protein n=1 Tax=Cavenderia fasciculata TaxID=261658 RepID=F4QCX1_CACFS|nr:uncharacterized protein DFA_12270 [Cavenderia fasciculata]EGG14495.1 hypothetical protein DFA_12270 [Cavenderia fasciculata]|eukprot:XP_004353904.1 hypothetical protein DFA_12270 [Cavenderia fasciculata]
MYYYYHPSRNDEKEKEKSEFLELYSFDPVYDAFQDHDTFMVRMELPGIPKSEVNIQMIDARTITISGDKKDFLKSPNHTYQLVSPTPTTTNTPTITTTTPPRKTKYAMEISTLL